MSGTLPTEREEQYSRDKCLLDPSISKITAVQDNLSRLGRTLI
jgi:hypothetical protein